MGKSQTECEMIMNAQRDFIKEVCTELNILLESFSQDYVLRLSKDGVTRQIFGAYWDVNSAAADRIACDKNACYTLLKNSNIPAIPHELFFNPQRRMGWAGPEGTWSHALRFFNSTGASAVLKPNQGTRGMDVYYCDSIPLMEAAAQTIFASYPSCAISPYVDIETEYRVFYHMGTCLFAYGKKAGDTWQHNLSQGAKAFELPAKSAADKMKLSALHSLATRAAKCVGINFATVDIAEEPSGKLMIMEINSGVQAKLLLDQLPHLRPIVKSIYAKAISGLFA